MGGSQDACAYSCNEPPRTLEPNGDISGLGVVLSFLLTAFMVVFLLTAYYLCIFDPDLDAFRKRDDRATKTPHPNPVDRVFLSICRTPPFSFIVPSIRQSQKWKLESTLNKCILLFADIQIVTGTAILVSGYAAVNCRLSTYHWQMLVHLAWFASMTHLSALTFLRHYLHNNPNEKLWRVSAMFVMLALLAVAIGPTAHFTWVASEDGNVSPAEYAACTYRMGLDTKTASFQSMLVSIGLLVYGYSIRLAKMSPRFTTRLRRMSSGLKDRSISLSSGWQIDFSGSRWQTAKTIVVQPLAMATVRLIHVQIDLLTSVLSEVYYLVISMVWGTLRLFYARRQGPSDENTWSFGQILPLALLAAPLISIVVYMSEYISSRGALNHNSEVSYETNETLSVQRNLSGLPLFTLENQYGQPRETPTTDDGSYEASSSFRGLFFLAAWAYVQYGMYILINTSQSFAKNAMMLGFEILVYQPLSQSLWVLWCFWLEKVRPRDWVAMALRFLFFFALFVTTAYRFGPTDQVGPEFGPAGFAIPTVVGLYVFQVAQAVVELKIGHSANARGQYSVELRQAILQLVASSVLLTTLLGLIIWLKVFDHQGAFLFGIAFGSKVLWFSVEAFFHWRQVSQKWQQHVRTAVFIMMWTWLTVWQYVLRTREMSNKKLFQQCLVFVSSFAALSLGWSIMGIMRLCIARV